MPDNQLQLIAYHGWGMGATFWNPLFELFDDTISAQASDRGYFSESKSAEFNTKISGKKVILTHSLGLHWCDDEVLSKADHLIILGGFLNFHPADKKESRKSKLILREMLSQFVESPQKVLQQFYENASSPSKNSIAVPENLNHDVLLGDLTLFMEDHFRQQRLFEVPEISIIHGSKDQIVSHHQAREMYHALRYSSQYFELKNAGHLFPIYSKKTCYNFIKSVLSSEVNKAI
ncbi:MAG: alpha/beta hydrolase [Balneolaceae bacterium]